MKYLRFPATQDEWCPERIRFTRNLQPLVHETYRTDDLHKKEFQELNKLYTTFAKTLKRKTIDPEND